MSKLCQLGEIREQTLLTVEVMFNNSFLEFIIISQNLTSNSGCLQLLKFFTLLLDKNRLTAQFLSDFKIPF